MRAGWLAAVAAGAALSALPPAAAAFRTGPPAAHTGGFGEPTCATCHQQDGGGAEQKPAALTIEAPTSYEPGATYDLRVTLFDTAARAAGFQLSVRLAEGAAAGRQAGSLAAPDSSVRVIGVETGVQYASHTARAVRTARGRATWVVRWTAPKEGGLVVFHAAGNAANDDDSEFGDRVHATERHAASR